MPEKWTGEAVGRMHVLQIQHKELANRMGITNRYLSMVLNGKRNPPGAEARVMGAIEMIESERNAESKTESSAG